MQGFTSMREALHGTEAFLVKRTLRLINNKLDEILRNKGCDASNMFDEEVPEQDLEFSDDEIEKEQKRMRKLKKRGDYEEGELLPERQLVGKKRQNERDNPNGQKSKHS